MRTLITHSSKNGEGLNIWVKGILISLLWSLFGCHVGMDMFPMSRTLFYLGREMSDCKLIYKTTNFQTADWGFHLKLKASANSKTIGWFDKTDILVLVVQPICMVRQNHHNFWTNGEFWNPSTCAIWFTSWFFWHHILPFWLCSAVNPAKEEDDLQS